jgi:hypothetical protein
MGAGKNLMGEFFTILKELREAPHSNTKITETVGSN